MNPEDEKIKELKSHDCHVIMQRLLTPRLCKFLPKDVSNTTANLCSFFQLMCARTLKIDDLKVAQQQVILIMCKLELIFPPTLFDIMVHLIMHLPNEAIQGGSVQSRWMYQFEHYIGKLKLYIQNWT